MTVCDVMRRENGINDPMTGNDHSPPMCAATPVITVTRAVADVASVAKRRAMAIGSGISLVSARWQCRNISVTCNGNDVLVSDLLWRRLHVAMTAAATM